MRDRFYTWLDNWAIKHYTKVAEKHPEVAEKFARARLGIKTPKEKR